MNRAQLEHLLTAASRVAERDEVLVIGSQSILGSYEETALPPDATMSREADFAFWDDESEAISDRVDAVLGELSAFDAEHGYYAQGVSVSTAVLPSGWRHRLVRYAAADGQVTGWCLEPHDLALSKLVAHRAKDKTFVRSLIEAGLLDVELLHARAADLPLAPAEIRAVRAEFSGWRERPL